MKLADAEEVLKAALERHEQARRFTYNENFKGFKLTKFDRITVTVGKKRKP